MNKSDKLHLSRVAALGCILCHHIHGEHDPAQVEIHHVRAGHGMGQRAGHREAIPLCIEHHRGKMGLHGMGTRAFSAHYGVDEMTLLDDVRRRLRVHF